MKLLARQHLITGLVWTGAFFASAVATAQDRPVVPAAMTAPSTPAATPQAAPPSAQTPAQPATPQADPVTVADEAAEGTQVRAGRSETVIQAPMEQVVRAMTDFTHYNEFMPHVRESRVIRRNRGTTDLYLQVPLGGSVGVIWGLLRINAQRTPDRMELTGQAVDSNMDRFETYTLIERVPGAAPSTRLTFRILALPRLPFPSSVFTREMRDVARTVATNVRSRVERMAALDGVRPAVPPPQTPANATSQR